MTNFIICTNQQAISTSITLLYSFKSSCYLTKFSIFISCHLFISFVYQYPISQYFKSFIIFIRLLLVAHDHPFFILRQRLILKLENAHKFYLQVFAKAIR